MAIRIVRVASSLPLQKLLHFNMLYAFCFGATQIALSIYKIFYLGGIATSKTFSLNTPPEAMRFIPLILIFIWIIIEILRLRIGYLGNLQERVPELAAFWLLTLLPQLPLTFFLSFVGLNGLLLSLDIALGIPIIIILLGQIRFGLPAVRALIRKQTADFYRICQEEALNKELVIHPPKFNTVNRNKYNNTSSSSSNNHNNNIELPNLTDNDLDQAVSKVSVTDILKEGMHTLTGNNKATDGNTNSLVNQSTNTLLAKNNTSTTAILRNNDNNASGTGLNIRNTNTSDGKND